MADCRFFPPALLLAAWLLALMLSAPTARAGGGPENVLLVVNASSWASQTVANHFIHLRKIPPSNVIYIDWNGGIDAIPSQVLRDKILGPALDAIEKRGLRPQIDYIVYSSDFPTSISLQEDFAGRVNFPKQYLPAASLNSATYLWNLVYSRLPSLVQEYSNLYRRRRASGGEELPSAGFRSWYGWGRQGELLEAGGQPFMLSTVLAVTSGRGNSVAEALSYLERSAAADGTHPKGTVYFSKTEDVRSTTRSGEFAAAVTELKKLGVRAEIISTVLPNNRGDVIGTMTGAPEFSWAKSRSKILPGAICEDFTSFGGVMGEGAGQTPLTEFLRYGAAGSSGTIVEPYAIPHKFPAPQMHVHYARGCTLAESYYQALFSPAQMLIVGDPLCRPWANIPRVSVSSPAPGATVSGTISLEPTAEVPGDAKISRYELMANGRRVATAPAGEPIAWDTTTLGDGFHELRIVAIDDSEIETQGNLILPIMVDNHGKRVQIAAAPAGKARWDENLQVRAKAPGAANIFIAYNGRVVGKIAGAAGTTTIPLKTMGLGPVVLYAIAMVGENNERVSSAPLPLVIAPPTPLPSLANAPKKLEPGILVKLADERVVPVSETRELDWLLRAGVDRGQAFVAQAFFDVPSDAMYQFQLWHRGSLKLNVDGKPFYNEAKGNFTEQFVPVSLAAGRHRVTMSGQVDDDPRMRILFGGPGAVSLNGTKFRHQAK